MTRKKPTKENPSKQGQIADMTPDRHQYDVEALEDFLNMVFHVELAHNEEVLTWITTKIPGYPMAEDDLYQKLSRVPLPKALYYSTATAYADPEDGRLYNRKALFKRLHVVVLDDIGTKVEFDDLPEDLIPTYTIETSPGNYQFGYVLVEPISVLEEAEMLIQLVYESGFSDTGGRMPNKLVRLPDGVNGKAGPKEHFKVRLAKMDGPLWTPADLLQVLDLGVTWDEVVKDAEGVMKGRSRMGAGLAAWSPIKARSPALSGIIDPVLEWLYDEEMVKQETQGWIKIICPWGDQHTSGDNTAGYSPMGWGDAAYVNGRFFHCFHDHCSSKSHKDFLQFVATSDGPQAPVMEYAGHLVSTYAYDPTSDGVWHARGQRVPLFIPLKGFRTMYPDKVAVPDFEGKMKMKAEVDLFIGSKARVTVMGQIFDPTTPNRITVRNDMNYLNTHTLPDWGDGAYDEDDVNTFTRFVAYLIPDAADREFFFDWLAAKCQSMAFRGPAILMIAPTQGTGRTTLGNMLAMMFGSENVENVDFDKLANHGDFNSWVTTPLIISNETLATGDYYKMYERVKDLIDTTPKAVRINPKYGKQRAETVYSSFLLFSNHAGAMSVAEDDRRIYVMNNTVKPESAKYFGDLNRWMKTPWQTEIWRWLRQRKVDVDNMLAPVVMTDAKKEMIRSTQSPIEVCITAILECWPSSLIATVQVKAAMGNVHQRLGVLPHKIDMVINKLVQEKTLAIKGPLKHRLNESSAARLKMIKGKMTPSDQAELLVETDNTHNLIMEYIEAMPDDTAMARIRKEVDEALDLHDF
jgi:hypothetical protein